jgi:hypothetical protein
MSLIFFIIFSKTDCIEVIDGWFLVERKVNMDGDSVSDGIICCFDGVSDVADVVLELSSLT